MLQFDTPHMAAGRQVFRGLRAYLKCSFPAVRHAMQQKVMVLGPMCYAPRSSKIFLERNERNNKSKRVNENCGRTVEARKCWDLADSKTSWPLRGGIMYWNQSWAPYLWKSLLPAVWWCGLILILNRLCKNSEGASACGKRV